MSDVTSAHGAQMRLRGAGGGGALSERKDKSAHSESGDVRFGGFAARDTINGYALIKSDRGVARRMQSIGSRYARAQMVA